MENFEFLIPIVLIILIGILSIFLLFRVMHREAPKWNAAVATIYVLIGGMSFLVLYFHPLEPTEQAYKFEMCYTPFAQAGRPSFYVWLILIHIAHFLLWRFGDRLPPLTLVLGQVLLVIGIVLAVAVMIQISKHSNAVHPGAPASVLLVLLYTLTSLHIGISARLLYKTVITNIQYAAHKVYENKLLGQFNLFLVTYGQQREWILVFLFPVVLLITMVLTLFGQEPDAMIRLFTDTATWRLSQKLHPPVLEPNSSHYLCTVATAGHPAIVKPLRLGKRHGKILIVNRQLQIANAFEALIQEQWARVHASVRRFYDRHGWNLSLYINTPFKATMMYLLMKPLEWFFLIYLYLFCIAPEHKIRSQYALV